eukprot:9151270-Pyramimonas_sp.AAC.1
MKPTTYYYEEARAEPSPFLENDQRLLVDDRVWVPLPLVRLGPKNVWSTMERKGSLFSSWRATHP